MDGIMADPVLGANLADVPYCSSDAHMGDGYNFGRPFRGTRILKAVLTDLVAKGLASSGGQKHTVILSGQSAGGRGAMVNLDYVQEMVVAAGGTEEIEVVGFLDSAHWMDIPRHW